MTIQLKPYSANDNEIWDTFASNCVNATFLHTQKFLSYHGARFNDCSLMIYEKERLIGLFPAAEAIQNNEKIVISHPGITFGGLIHDGRLTGQKLIDTLRLICNHFFQLGYMRLIYKCVPTIYQSVPSNDDIYALFRLSAERYRVDLSSTVDIHHRLPINERRKRALKKAEKNVIVRFDLERIFDFYAVLENNLHTKHGAKPVHSLIELQQLLDWFPKNISLCYATNAKNELVAGVLLFASKQVLHTQYIASNEEGKSTNALDAIFKECIEYCKKSDLRYFDFGISNENNGLYLNEGLYSFKTEFGGGGMIHEFYKIDLEKVNAA